MELIFYCVKRRSMATLKSIIPEIVAGSYENSLKNQNNYWNHFEKITEYYIRFFQKYSSIKTLW